MLRALYGGGFRWWGSALLLACSSSDAGREELPNGSTRMPGDGEEGTPPAAASSSPAAAPGPSNGEAPSENLPLSPAPAPSGASPTMPPPGVSPPGVTAPGVPPAEAASPTAPEAPLGEPVQAPLPALLTVRQEHAVVALGGEVYVIGGFTPMATATVEAFNPSSETWRSVAPFPVVLNHANAASVNGLIYVAGFYLGGSFSNADARVYAYDPALDAWSERSAMPAGTGRASGCVASFEGKVYVFGGARAATVSDASVYDVATDAWRVLPPLPEPREHCLAGEVGGTLYIASGRAGGITGFQPNTWAFNPRTDTYAARAPIPTPRGGAAGAVLGGRLHVFGGEGNPAGGLGVFTNVDAYEPATDTWQALPAMLTPRHGFGAAETGGRIYLPGGAVVQGFGAANDHTVVSFAAPAL